MLDFDRLSRKEMTLPELVAGLTKSDLRDLTHEMIDRQLALIAGCTDADVTFTPVDPNANDPYAADQAEVDIAWTLGHVIVHVSASSEEAAFIAAEMARGILRDGRSRYETPWETVTTIAECRARLEESRRMRLATLEVWPDAPHFEVTRHYNWMNASIDAIGRFVLGLNHDHAHLEQIAEIVRQARAARVPA